MGRKLDFEAAFQPALLDSLLPATGGPAKVGATASGYPMGVRGDRSLGGLDDSDQVPLGGFLGASDATALRDVPSLGQGRILFGAICSQWLATPSAATGCASAPAALSSTSPGASGFFDDVLGEPNLASVGNHHR